MSNIIDINHRQIEPGDNVRKHFAPGPLAELRESLREHGLQQNLVGYRSPNDAERIILVAGERRWRATGDLLEDLLGKGELDLHAARRMMPVKIIPLEEVPKARELNLVENLNREGITALEEADGYYEMSRATNPATGANYTIKEIARVVGKKTTDGEPDEKYIQRRLKLRRAPEFFLDAVNEGKVAATTAELVGQLADKESREQFAKMILRPEDDERPLDFDQAKRLKTELFQVSLVKCGFDLAADLVPIKMDGGVRVQGGKCDDCPWKTGNIPDIQEELATGRKGGKAGGKPGISPDLCTNPACFRLKKAAHWRTVLSQASHDGSQTMDGAEAKKLFSGYEGALPYDSKFVDLSKRMAGSELGGGNINPPEWGKVAKDVEAPVIYALHPATLNVVRLAEKAPLLAKYKAALKAKDGKSKDEGGDDTEKKQRAAEALKQKISMTFAQRAAMALVDQVSPKGFGLDELQLAFEIALEGSGADGSFFIGKMLKLKGDGTGGSGRTYQSEICKHVAATATTRTQKEAWIALALVARDLKSATGPWAGGVKGCTRFVKLCKAYGLDLNKIEAEVTAEIKAGKQPKKPADAGKLTTKSRSKSAQRNADMVDHGERAGLGMFGRGPEDGQTADERKRRSEPGGDASEFGAETDEVNKARQSITVGELDPVKAGLKPKKPSKAERLKAALKTPGTTTKERVAAPDVEALAFAKWKETGSIKDAAEAAGVAVDTVKNWHKRRKWTAKK